MRHQAIYNTHSAAICIRDEVAYDTDNNAVVLDEAKIKVEQERLQAAFDTKAYARNRAAEYPAIHDLVVALYDTDDRAAVDAKRAAVKAKYPKPG